MPIFKATDKVQHVKTGGIYVIDKVPDNYSKLEYCNETYYAYSNGQPNIQWLRCKSEMEDGRFVLVEQHQF